MSEDRNETSSMFQSRAGRMVRDILAAVIAVAAIGLAFVLAFMLATAFFFVLGLALLVGGAYWLWLKVRRGRKGEEGSPEILVATRGPKGWTVDGMGGSGQ
ncbi:MAG: hypothetical protein GYB36_13085 [Alphaproteobacteria bacterium]|nr:hypothetical protein [Alphaproteobacteria bacterium]